MKIRKKKKKYSISKYNAFNAQKRKKYNTFHFYFLDTVQCIPLDFGNLYYVIYLSQNIKEN
jgi:hypothetical protein